MGRCPDWPARREERCRSTMIPWWPRVYEAGEPPVNGRGRHVYPRMLRTAAAAGKVDRIVGVGCAPGHQPSWLPGYEPSPAGGVTVEPPGPAPETVGGVEALRWFGDAGKGMLQPSP